MQLLKFLFLILISQVSMAANFNLQSSSFKANEKIPLIYTCNGKNISPQLSWTNPPANTKSYALILSTPGWPELVFLWVLYDIPITITSLPENANDNLPSSISVGSNLYRYRAYSGPCPPDSRVHHYVFTIYALDTAHLSIEDDTDAEEILEKVNSHTLEKAELTAVFNH